MWTVVLIASLITSVSANTTGQPLIGHSPKSVLREGNFMNGSVNFTNEGNTLFMHIQAMLEIVLKNNREIAEDYNK